MVITVPLIYTLYKSLQLQHTLNLLSDILLSLVIDMQWLLTTEIPHSQTQAAIAHLQLTTTDTDSTPTP
jgi:hypothetical protein